jgi:hypothetical protein
MSGLFAGPAAKKEAEALVTQAAWSKVQARSEALKYKQQGVEVLRNINRTMGAINARSGAGSVDPFSGNSDNLALGALSLGANELYNTMAGQTISLTTGELKAKQFGLQAQATLKRAQAEAFGTILETGFKIAMV